MQINRFRRVQCVVPSSFIFFNDTATTEIYTLSLHDALPIYRIAFKHADEAGARARKVFQDRRASVDRESTRLKSSHRNISYAVLCLKKKPPWSRYMSGRRRRRRTQTPACGDTRE